MPEGAENPRVEATALKELSEHTRVPQQVYIREGVDLVLDKHAKDDVFKRFIDRRLRRALKEKKS
ncbi:MAG TPA: ribbon-helix-helix domain-containing protein [Gemmatimonadales bacterium]|nr:ribbon-helix-helix domain-containing protein [Gemmatimonadales bacterium]